MASKPTQRSLAMLRDLGYEVAIVEKYNHHTRRKHDLFGFADLLAVDPRLGGVLMIQTTDGSHIAERVRKMLTEAREGVIACLKAGVLVRAHGWTKRKKPVNGKYWVGRVVRLEYLEAADEVIAFEEIEGGLKKMELPLDPKED